MTRSSTNELYIPYKDPEREFRSSKKHFKSLSLAEFRSLDFNLLFDKEYSKEEEEEALAEIMSIHEQDSRTHMDRDGSDNEDANEHIEKVLKIFDLFHVFNITVDQLMLRVFHISLTGSASRWLRNEPTGTLDEVSSTYLTEMREVIFFYNGLDVPTRQILDSRGAVPTKTAADAKTAIQEMAEYSKKWHNGTSRGRKDGKALEEAYYTQFDRPFQGGGYRATAPGYYQRNNANPSFQERRQSMEDTLSKFMSESAKRHEENSNLIKEIRASTDAAIRKQGASIKTLEIQIGQMSKVLQERGFEAYQAQLKQTRETKSKEGNYGPKFTEAYGASHINNAIPRKEKDPRSFTLPCFINDLCFDNALVDLGASVSVMPFSTYLNLELGELAHTKLTVELADRTVKYPKGIAENVLVGIGKFVFLVDFIILDMPEDIKVPLILRRPFLSTARAKIDVYERKITLRIGEERIIFKSVKPASSLIKRVYMLSLRKRTELDLEARLIGETLVINTSLYPLNGDYIEFNNLNEPFELR
ncbi:hypothetical protein Tco_1115529, partial [Tanacetum coccineum]